MGSASQRTSVLAALAAGGVLFSCTLSTDLDGLAEGTGASGGAGQTSTVAATGTSTTGGAGGAGGGGGAAPGESCTDGIDNDGDQLVDCADPDCGDFSCAEAPPEGWSGPAILYVGAQAAPACPGGARGVDGGSGTVDASPASCTACSCGDPAGAICQPATVSYYGADNCSNMKKDQGAGAFDVCQSNGPCCVKSAIGDSLTSTGGMCAKGSSTPTTEPPSWTTNGRVCAGSLGGGCGAGSVCAPKPASPFGPTPCVFHDGDVACPAGPFSVKTALLTVVDDWGCSACACSDPSGVVCTGHVVVFADEQCGAGLSVDVPNDGVTCVTLPFGDAKGSTAFLDSGPTGGKCAASGGLPIGGVTPGPGVTVCCAP